MKQMLIVDKIFSTTIYRTLMHTKDMYFNLQRPQAGQKLSCIISSLSIFTVGEAVRSTRANSHKSGDDEDRRYYFWENLETEVKFQI